MTKNLARPGTFALVCSHMHVTVTLHRSPRPCHPVLDDLYGVLQGLCAGDQPTVDEGAIIVGGQLLKY
jgi:hypothetical protein